MLDDTMNFGEHLRWWRDFRRRSQLDFSLDAEISQRHLSFLETGRSQPTRVMILRLCEVLDVPLRERNLMLVAAGFAPVYKARDLANPALAQAEAAIRQVLDGHDPCPALALDRHWNAVATNAAARRIMQCVADHSLIEPPVNVLRLTLAPGGLADRIVNLAEWRGHLIRRLKHQFALTGDPGLNDLLRETQQWPAPEDVPHMDPASIIVPLRLATPIGDLSFFSTTTLFGMPMDITLSEIAIESFFPADEATRTLMAQAAAEA
ncbi:helix-turn-helix transcriptional regulator [Paracoccus caeni]|uniref:Helix-turn-helix transcriptional regulator n=2 Tax=Paracoccus caeni TaxID=657651 RepID=A0A934SBX7_9RHOB|nr:helix-turn-helix transcriptional regulator [Paracoccus caeni]